MQTAPAPSKMSILSPSRSSTIAFFQPGRVPRCKPRRFGLDFTVTTLTPSTVTSKSSSTAWRIWVLCAFECTLNEYLLSSIRL